MHRVIPGANDMPATIEATGAVTDPTALYRLRDGVYAADLLIVAVCELDLFTWLADRGQRAVGPADASSIARDLGLAARPVDVLLTYLTALGLLERRGDTVALTTLARDHLIAGSPLDLRPYYASLRERPGCTQLLQVLRTGRPAAWASAEQRQDWAGRLADPRFAETITAAMDARGRYLGPALARVLGDLPVQRVLDVGGSSGIYTAAMVDALGVTGAVFERPPVDAVARTLLADRGYSDHIAVHAGDMFTAPLPPGYDLHLFSHVLHDWGAEDVRRLLAAAYDALEPGGYLVDHDVHVNENKTGPLAAAEYSVFLMHATPGKSWSTSELTKMLNDTGFTDVTVRPTAADRTAVIARKP
jgi:SAM-dependent methyltransferase